MIVTACIRAQHAAESVRHPSPFQIDGNFGYTAGVCEMLLQSHPGEIHFFPPCRKPGPPAASRIAARGNFTVDIQWKDGQVTNYRITSPDPRGVKIRVNGQVKTVQAEK